MPRRGRKVADDASGHRQDVERADHRHAPQQGDEVRLDQRPGETVDKDGAAVSAIDMAVFDDAYAALLRLACRRSTLVSGWTRLSEAVRNSRRRLTSSMRFSRRTNEIKGITDDKRRTKVRLFASDAIDDGKRINQRPA